MDCKRAYRQFVDFHITTYLNIDATSVTRVNLRRKSIEAIGMGLGTSVSTHQLIVEK